MLALSCTFYLVSTYRYKLCSIGDRHPYLANATIVVWFPSEFEIAIGQLYSPGHACLWILTDHSNWFLTIPAMLLIGIQVQSCVHISSERLLIMVDLDVWPATPVWVTGSPEEIVQSYGLMWLDCPAFTRPGCCNFNCSVMVIVCARKGMIRTLY